MSTISELKQQATDLGLSFKAKILKVDLEALIEAKLAELTAAANKAFVDANSVRIPPRLLPNSAPRNVPLTSAQRGENYQNQNGWNSKKRTPKQEKRLRKKEHRNG